MALIKCDDCGKDVSTLAVSCPSCGCPIEKNEISIPDGSRIMCPDGRCTGIINRTGTCGICGKHYLWNKEENSEDNIINNNVARDDNIRCPYCKSTQVSAQKNGFGLGKSVVGLCVAGPVGLMGGFLGSGNIKITCLSCGKSWKAGETISSVVCPNCRQRNKENSNYCACCKTPL